MSLLKRLGSRLPEPPASPGGPPKTEGAGERIALLLIEDNLAQAQLVRELLAEVPHIFFQIVHADRLSSALQRLAKERFDVILSDLKLPDSDGLQTFEQVHAQAPGTPIVVFSGLTDVSLAIQAVQGGAQDYLIKGEVNGATLVRALSHAIERHRQAPQVPSSGTRGKLLGFVGAKGGVGTTTVALNLATLLAAQQPTILVELRPSLGTLASHLQNTFPETLATLSSLNPREINERALRRCLVSGPSRLQVLCAPSTLQESGSLSLAQLDALLSGLRAIAECVMLDLTPTPLEVFSLAIQQCDIVTIVSEPDPVALKASQALLAALAGWGISASQVNVLLVHRSGAGNLTTLSEAQTMLRAPILGVIPPAAEACLIAMSQGLPLVLSQPHHRAATTLREISKTLVPIP
ncbi:MAG: response regulator [Ardenticatenales bacterium]|nr:response regulator [Ardenticatenales bacterium]